MIKQKIKFTLSSNYFVGIEIPDYIKEEIHYFIHNNMKKFDILVDWIQMNEYHITLAYLGKITEEQRLRLIMVFNQVKIPPFTISIQGTGFFPPGKNPKSIWIGVEQGRETINVISESIRSDIANKAGLIPKDFFYPHITIGKIKNNNSNEIKTLFHDIRTNWDYPFGKFNINSFHLYKIIKNGYQLNYEVKLIKRPSLIIE